MIAPSLVAETDGAFTTSRKVMVMDSIIESWTCQIEGDLATFFEQLHADVTTVWMYSRIGHRAPGCKPVIGDKNAYFTFTGDAGALAAITARMYRPGWLVIVIDRCRTEPEDIDPEYATWAEIGQKVTTWLRGWIRECYRVEPMPQRAGRPSWDDYDEPTTPDQGRKVESVTPEVQEEFSFDGSVEEFNAVAFASLKTYSVMGIQPGGEPTPEDVVKIDTLPMSGNRTLLTITIRGDRGRATWERLRTELETRLGYTIQPTAATGDQGGGVTPATPTATPEVQRRGASAGTFEKVQEAHRLRKQGKQWREIKRVCSHETYTRWCFEATGEEPI